MRIGSNNNRRSNINNNNSNNRSRPHSHYRNNSMSSNGNSRSYTNNPLNKVYESNGPGVKVRGNAETIVDKYISLARDAQVSGDYIGYEGFMQHAEHYRRIILAHKAAMSAEELALSEANSSEAQNAEKEENLNASSDQDKIFSDDEISAENSESEPEQKGSDYKNRGENSRTGYSSFREGRRENIRDHSSNPDEEKTSRYVKEKNHQERRKNTWEKNNRPQRQNLNDEAAISSSRSDSEGFVSELAEEKELPSALPAFLTTPMPTAIFPASQNDEVESEDVITEVSYTDLAQEIVEAPKVKEKIRRYRRYTAEESVLKKGSDTKVSSSKVLEEAKEQDIPLERESETTKEV